MRRKNNVAAIDPDLLQQFAGVAMAEDAVRREIVRRIHEMRLRRRRLARAAHAALGIRNNAMRNINKACCKSGRTARMTDVA